VDLGEVERIEGNQLVRDGIVELALDAGAFVGRLAVFTVIQ
jgi:hypothetical protein